MLESLFKIRRQIAACQERMFGKIQLRLFLGRSGILQVPLFPLESANYTALSQFNFANFNMQLFFSEKFAGSSRKESAPFLSFHKLGELACGGPSRVCLSGEGPPRPRGCSGAWRSSGWSSLLGRWSAWVPGAAFARGAKSAKRIGSA